MAYYAAININCLKMIIGHYQAQVV